MPGCSWTSRVAACLTSGISGVTLRLQEPAAPPAGDLLPAATLELLDDTISLKPRCSAQLSP